MIFDPEDDAQREILELRKSNEERLHALAQRGIQLQISGRSDSIIELLLDHLMGTTDVRLKFEHDFASGIATMLDQAEQQIRQAQLTQGVADDPRVVQQIARNNGGALLGGN